MIESQKQKSVGCPANESTMFIVECKSHSGKERLRISGISSRAIHTYKNSQDGGWLASVLFSNINKKIRDYSSSFGLEVSSFLFSSIQHAQRRPSDVCACIALTRALTLRGV
ncbi:hypothetical protein TNCT_190631 [Trichonephila clavata]|uniref:Uncharacterized protein n=1 Tax=Trichonephila clavata TaxID=2740835 RepID=A0A8X6GWH3_TRICU|nr:hypothetical protein TNCT_190631 [Trichonephila clavata]